jgi:hypothetical protein
MFSFIDEFDMPIETYLWKFFIIKLRFINSLNKWIKGFLFQLI